MIIGPLDLFYFLFGFDALYVFVKFILIPLLIALTIGYIIYRIARWAIPVRSKG